MFEKASRMKLRFETSRGIVSVEDLWDFSLTNLDKLAQDLNKQVKASAEKSFIVKKRTKDAVASLRFELVKYIIEVKMAEAETRMERAENKAKREKILSILEDKEDEALKEMSAKDLKKMAKNL